jgi:hypothetical protein
MQEGRGKSIARAHGIHNSHGVTGTLGAIAADAYD